MGNLAYLIDWQALVISSHLCISCAFLPARSATALQAGGKNSFEIGSE